MALVFCNIGKSSVRKHGVKAQGQTHKPAPPLFVPRPQYVATTLAALLEA